MYTADSAPQFDFFADYAPKPVHKPHVPHYPEPEVEECSCEEQEDKIFELEWEKEFLHEKVKTLMG